MENRSVIAAEPSSFKRGLFFAVIAYIGWGASPLYWKLLDQVGFFGLVSHRMFWSFVLMYTGARFMRGKELKALFRDKRALKILGLASILIAATWWVFIYAVNSGNSLQAALGYYINPLMSIIAGVVIFKEKLTGLQKVASILAAAGVIFFTVNYGSFPWISITLALLFAVYGAIKKIGGYPAIPALAVETTIVAPLALVFVVISFFLPGNGFMADTSSVEGWTTTVLLVGGALVTILPLLWYAEAVNALPPTWIGFLQYMSPTVTLLIGVFLFGEPFTLAHAVCFALIWTGLLLISIELFVKSQKAKKKSGSA